MNKNIHRSSTIIELRKNENKKRTQRREKLKKIKKRKEQELAQAQQKKEIINEQKQL